MNAYLWRPCALFQDLRGEFLAESRALIAD